MTTASNDDEEEKVEKCEKNCLKTNETKKIIKKVGRDENENYFYNIH